MLPAKLSCKGSATAISWQPKGVSEMPPKIEDVVKAWELSDAAMTYRSKLKSPSSAPTTAFSVDDETARVDADFAHDPFDRRSGAADRPNRGTQSPRCSPTNRAAVVLEVQFPVFECRSGLHIRRKWLSNRSARPRRGSCCRPSSSVLVLGAIFVSRRDPIAERRENAARGHALEIVLNVGRIVLILSQFGMGSVR